MMYFQQVTNSCIILMLLFGSAVTQTGPWSPIPDSATPTGSYPDPAGHRYRDPFSGLQRSSGTYNVGPACIKYFKGL